MQKIEQLFRAQEDCIIEEHVKVTSSLDEEDPLHQTPMEGAPKIKVFEKSLQHYKF